MKCTLQWQFDILEHTKLESSIELYSVFFFFVQLIIISHSNFELDLEKYSGLDIDILTEKCKILLANVKLSTSYTDPIVHIWSSPRCLKH